MSSQIVPLRVAPRVTVHATVVITVFIVCWIAVVGAIVINPSWSVPPLEINEVEVVPTCIAMHVVTCVSELNESLTPRTALAAVVHVVAEIWRLVVARVVSCNGDDLLALATSNGVARAGMRAVASLFLGLSRQERREPRIGTVYS